MSKKKTDAKNAENTKETEKKVSSTACESEELKKQLEEKDAEIAANKDQYQRLLAEYDNFKKRTSREKEAIYSDSVKDTVAALLPVLDNLERALSSFEDKENEHFKGVEMILKQTEEIFTKLGVTEIKSVGEQFNPELHNAVMHIDDETIDENTVVEQFQKGYVYKDKVIRYSMVKVAN